MQLIHVLAMVLASIRLTEIVTQDRVSDFARRLFPTYLLTCGRCVSVWAGVACLFIYVRWPMGNWPFAMSAVYVISGRLAAFASEPRHRETPVAAKSILIESDAQGNVHLKKSDFTVPALCDIFRKLTAALEEGMGK